MIPRLAILMMVWLAAPASAERTLILAAASLAGPLDRALAATEAEAVVSYGSSAALARQIMAGAPASLFISANPAWAGEVEAAVPGAVARDYLGNRLVLVGPPGAAPVALEAGALGARLGDGRLAIGLTRAVPAGIYGRAALDALGLWEAVSDRLAEVENVRVALALVARGEAPLGLVYATDARAEPGVSVVAEVPETAHPEIVYVLVALDDAGAELAEALSRPEVLAIFGAAGFEVPGR